MNDRQRAFADQYLVTGNAAEAARRAGYAHKNARRTGHRLLSNVDIIAYLDAQRERLASERIATTTEVLEMLTDIMRGDVPDVGGRDVNIADRIRAAREIIKREPMNDRFNLPIIIDDIGDNETVSTTDCNI